MIVLRMLGWLLLGIEAAIFLGGMVVGVVLTHLAKALADQSPEPVRKDSGERPDVLPRPPHDEDPGRVMKS